MCDAFGAATGEKNDGQAEQVSGTAGLELTGASALVIVQELRSIMRVHLRTQPALLAAWASPSHEESWRDEVPATAPSSPPAEGGSGS